VSTSIAITNLRTTPFAHPEFSVLAALASKTKTLKQVNADDYSANYPLLAAFGVAVSVDGAPAAGAVFATAAHAMTATETAVVCDNGATPRTVTLAASSLPLVDGFEVYVYHRTGAGAITVAAGVGDTVDGGASITLAAGEVARLRLDLAATNWVLL
jgi:hypothetical protein